MAKKYRTERDLLTVELPLEIPARQLPEGVSPGKSGIIKISAYPAVWRWLHEVLNGDSGKQDRRIIDDFIEKAIQDARNKIPLKRIKKKNIVNDDFDGSFEYEANKADRIAKGKHHRGPNKLRHVITDEIHDKARWVHWFFLFWRDRKLRPENIQLIYDARKVKTGKATKDPISMTYFVFRYLYEDELRKLGESFPAQESFRTNYLKNLMNKRISLRNLTEENVNQMVENRKHQLSIIAEICIKLQK